MSDVGFGSVGKDWRKKIKRGGWRGCMRGAGSR